MTQAPQVSRDFQELVEDFKEKASVYVYAYRGGRQFSAGVYLQKGKLRNFYGKARLARSEAVEMARKLHPHLDGPSRTQCEILITAEALSGRKGRHDVPDSILEAREMLAREARRVNEEKAPSDMKDGEVLARVRTLLEEFRDESE